MQEGIVVFPVDIAVFITAVLANVLMIGIFAARVKGMEKLEYYLGIIFVILILPAGYAVFQNLTDNREWWTYVLPLVLILFCLVELLFDYVLKLDFRNTALKWPYIVSFYAALFGMIGYSFLIGKTYGYIMLVLYFINLFATWRAHR